MRFFRPSTLEDLPVSIAGIKLGDRVLMLGCGDPSLIARLAVKTGLTGRAAALDEQEARTARTAEVATREGALVETITAPWTALPLDEGAFDVTIVRDVLASLPGGLTSGLLGEVRRVLRPGGRCLVIESVPRGGLAGLRNGAVHAEVDFLRLVSPVRRDELQRIHVGLARLGAVRRHHAARVLHPYAQERLPNAHLAAEPFVFLVR